MPFTMSGNNDGWSFNRFNEYEAKLAEEQGEEKKEEEVLEEGIDFKAAKREDERRKKIQDEKDKKSPSSKDYRLALRKFRPGASQEERAEGGRDVMREKGTSPIKDGKKMFEALEATGMFTTEEIEAIVESSCGGKGYQEGGEVKECEKCKGKGCDHCEGKGTHKKEEEKEEVKEAAKPDFLDMDGDGDKKEPMKKAIKEKGGKKKDAVVEAAVAALAPLLGKAAGAAKAATAGAKAAGVGSAIKGAAKTAAVDAAMDLGGKGVRAVTSLPGKVMDAGKSTVKDSEVEEA